VVRIGFVVEGVSDKKLIESTTFKDWANQECGLQICDYVANAIAMESKALALDIYILFCVT